MTDKSDDVEHVVMVDINGNGHVPGANVNDVNNSPKTPSDTLSDSTIDDDEEDAKFDWNDLKSCKGSTMFVLRFLYSLFPILDWAPKYPKTWKDTLMGDLQAAVTVGVLLVPQGLAYALLAELPVQYGLYSAFIPPLVYGLMGTSKELSVAPVAVASLLTSSGLSTLYDPQTQTQEYVGAAISLALLLGIVQLAMGLLRLGFVINFLSHSVLSGFTSAAALVIGLSQLKHVLGLDIPRSSHVHEILEHAFKEIEHSNWRTIIISLCCFVVLLVWKYAPRNVKVWKYIRQMPSAMIVVVFTTLASSQLNLNEDFGVSIVGDVPSGLAAPKAPPTKDFGDLIVLALTIAMITYMESMAIAKKYADIRGYQLDFNQELIALGFCNIVGSGFQTFPTTGGFSRTAVNANAGAKTQLATILSALIVMIALLAATDLFFHLPKAALACIIMVAVFPLVDVMEPIRLWKISKLESLLVVVTFALSAFLGIEIGVGVSIGLALLLVVFEASRPHYALEGRLGETDIYRNVKRYPGAVVPDRTVIFRFDANLFFANSAYFERKFKQRCLRRKIRRIILDCASVNTVDPQGMHLLEHLYEEAIDHHDKLVVFASVKGPVRDLFAKVGFTEKVGPHRFYDSVHQAVVDSEAEMDVKFETV